MRGNWNVGVGDPGRWEAYSCARREFCNNAQVPSDDVASAGVIKITNTKSAAHRKQNVEIISVIIGASAVKVEMACTVATAIEHFLDTRVVC